MAPSHRAITAAAEVLADANVYPDIDGTLGGTGTRPGRRTMAIRGGRRTRDSGRRTAASGNRVGGVSVVEGTKRADGLMWFYRGCVLLRGEAADGGSTLSPLRGALAISPQS